MHVHYANAWATMNETHICDINARFPAKAANHYQFESYLQSGVMARGLSLIAPDQNWLAGTADKPRKPWEWRVDIDRTRDEPHPALIETQRAAFELMHRLLTYAFDTMAAQAHGLIKCAPSVSVGGTTQSHADTLFQDNHHPFDHPYFWAGFVVVGDGEVRPSGGE